MNDESKRRYYAKYSEELIQEALKLMETQSMSATARQLGINRSQLYRWKRRTEPHAAPKLHSLSDVNVKDLLRENQLLRQEVEFLKKAKAYFAKQKK